MEIEKTYIKKVNNSKYFVYVGKCDNIPTKWITRSTWNYKIFISYNKEIGDIEYRDNRGKEILVYEQDDKDWNKW